MIIETQVPRADVLVRVNNGLYDKIRQVRNCKMNVRCQVLDSSNPIYKSWVKKNVTSVKTSKTYVITDVFKHWFWGWYYVASLVQENGSGRMIYLQNESCETDIICQSIKEHQQEFGLTI